MQFKKIDTDKNILIFDIETTDIEILARSYLLKNYIRYFNPKSIIRDWTMLGAAWKWKGENTAQVVSVSPDDPLNDGGVVRALYEALNEADVIIGHNSDKFDLKKFNTRAIYHDLPPLAPKMQIDTLKIARNNFAFTSNRLSYLADFLKVGQFKDESPDWIKCIEGCSDELRYMRKYNKQDIYVTELVYDKLMSYHKTHPNIAGIKRDIEGIIVPHTCPRCGSGSTIKRGKLTLNSGRQRQRHYCNDCNSWFKGRIIK